jgi:hypothetical protein
MNENESICKSLERTYTCVLESSELNGEAHLFANEDALEISLGGQIRRIPYSSVLLLSRENYTVRIRADDGTYLFSRLGAEEEWLYDDLYKAIRLKTQASFFETGTMLIEAEARYLMADQSGQFAGKAIIRVFDGSILILTPDRNARRLPLVFLKTIMRESYSIRMTFDSGENCTLFEAGYDLTPLVDAVQGALERLAKRRAADLSSLLPSLRSSELNDLQLSYRMNTAVPVTRLPPALEIAMQRHFTGNLAVTYPRLKTLGDSKKLALGFAAVAEGDIPYDDASAVDARFEAPESSAEDARFIFWALLPSEDHKYAALELCLPAEAAAATYIFRTGGTVEDFLQLFNRAFEACRFRREFLTFTDAELLTEGAGAYKILVDRTPSIIRLRSLAAGRIIHSSPEAWEQKLLKAFAGNGEDLTGTVVSAASTTPTRFCPNCACRISAAVRFCTECGTEL